MQSSRHDLLERGEQRALHVEVLDDRLDDETARRVRREIPPATSPPSVMRASSASAAARVEPSLLDVARQRRADASRARFAPAPACASPSTTRWPAAAATCAMPRPIAPAPTTPTISSGELATSSSLETRLSLLDEGAHAFGVVRPSRPPRAAAPPRARAARRGRWRSPALKPRLIRPSPRVGIAASRSAIARSSSRRAVARARRRRRVPTPSRACASQLLAEHRQRGRALQSDDARQDERPAAVGDEADLRERLDERRVLGREHDVAGEGEVRAGARGDAVHRADHRLLERADARG